MEEKEKKIGMRSQDEYSKPNRTERQRLALRSQFRAYRQEVKNIIAYVQSSQGEDLDD